MSGTIPAPATPISAELQAVHDARARLVSDIETLDHEVRLEVAYRMEKIAWKVVTAAAAAGAAIVVRKVLDAAWNKVRPDPPPSNPADPSTGWTDAVIWSAATGIGMGVARMFAERTAAQGWKRATGRIPPPFEKFVGEPTQPTV